MILPRLLVTRPADRQEPFATRARALGVDTLAFPCVEITEAAELTLPDADCLVSADAVLFTSRAAVDIVARARPFPWPDAQVYAIGEATAHALRDHGQPLQRAPTAPYNSEAVLADWIRRPPMRQVIIIKGDGGRKLLEQELRLRGTSVHVLDVYRRSRPASSPHDIDTLLSVPPLDILSVTSNEILDNLMVLAGACLPALLPLPLIVNSQRGASHARDSGFRGDIHVADPAGDEGQLVALQAWLKRR